MKTEAQLIDKELIQENIGILSFELDHHLNFKPGQFCNISVDKGLTRPYSMTNLPGTTLEFYIKSYPDGDVAHEILDLDVGDVTRMTGPLGNFTLQKDTDTIYLIGAGSGVAPLMSMARSLHNTNVKVCFLHGVSHVNELGYHDELQSFASNDGFNYVPTISRPEANPEWDGKTGRVETQLQYCTETGAEVYLCGPPPMVETVTETLTNRGFDNIFTEEYY